MLYVKLDNIVELLLEYADLKNKDLKLIETVKPTHGNCCTCQACGYGHDECVCLHNDIVSKINSLEKIDL